MIIKNILNHAIRFFKGFIGWLRILLGELYNNGITVIIIFMLYLAFWNFPQTIDLLLIFNQIGSFANYQVPLYFSLLTLLAILIRYASSYLNREVYQNLSFKKLFGDIPDGFQQHLSANRWYLYRWHIKRTLPKVLSVLLLFITSYAILHAAESFGINNNISKVITSENLMFITFLFAALLLYFPFYRRLRDFVLKIPKSKYFVAFFSIVLFGIIILVGILNNQDKQDVLKLFIANITLTFLFSVFAFGSRFFSNRVLIILYNIARVLLGVVFLLFFLFSISPGFSRSINPLSVIIISFITFFIFAFTLLLLGKKSGIPLLGVFIFVVFIIGRINASKEGFDHFEITYVETDPSYKRVSIEEHIKNWVEDRKTAIDSSTTYPVIFVSSQGGGSRAGLWSFLTHSYLHEKNPNYFEKHLFSLSGSSGGSVGNAMFYAAAIRGLKTEQTTNFKTTDTSSVYTYKASEIYRENFLSSSIAALLGRDLFQSIFEIFSFDNRGDLLEKEWEKAHTRVFNTIDNQGLSKDVLSFYSWKKQEKTPPLLLLNTTHTQTGQYSVISPVSFENNSEFLGFRDFIGNLQAEDRSRSVKLSTAMSLGARFPYVSPVGEVKGLGQYADAGYYDNIGGRVTKNIRAVFTDFMLKNYPEQFSKTELINLVIMNEDEDYNATNISVTQLQAPLTTLLNVRSGHTREMMNYLGKDWQIILKRTPVLQDEKKDTITPVLPIGRYLSPIVIQSVEKRLKDDTVSKRLNSLVLKMVPYE